MIEPTFLYLNRDGLWPDFHHLGLERQADGTLYLINLPRLVEGSLADLKALSVPDAPSGIAVAHDGRVFWSDPENGTVLSRDPCDATMASLPGLSSSAFGKPRGLAIHPGRGALMVADAEAGRIWLLSADAQTIAEWWPVPDAAEGEASRPLALAVLGEHVYVLDATGPRIHKLTLHGRPIADFAEVIDAHQSLQRPTAIAAHDGEIFVLDADRSALVVVDEEGAEVRTFNLAGIDAPMGLAVDGRAVLVGDSDRRAIIQFDGNGGLVGRAIGYRGPVAALALTGGGDLWVSPGHGVAPLRLAARGGHVRKGALWGGPFGFADTAHLWGRLSALGSPVSEGAHFRFLTFLTDDANEVPPEPDADLASWTPGPPDVADIYIGEEAQFLWVAGLFEGDGLTSPRVEQIRVEADHETYSRYLPPLYIREPAHKKTIDRFLALFESQYADVELSMAHMAQLFDQATVSEQWLDWLAGWLAVPLDEGWPEGKKRQAISRGFESHSRRGTARGLKEMLQFEFGIQSAVEEPLIHSEWWALSGADDDQTSWQETSLLGLTTMLTAGPPEGAVLGATAALDQSRIITDAEFGAPLFDERAHRFTILLYRPAATDPRLVEAVRAAVDREKPAHTAYTVCTVEPSMRVGYQAILGVDTVVAGGPPPASTLGGTATSQGIVLAGSPPGRLGTGAVVGKTSHLGDGIVGAD